MSSLKFVLLSGFSLLIEIILLLSEPLIHIRKLCIQTFNLLVLPLLLLSQNLEVKLDIGSIISLELADINLVLKLHQAVLVGVTKLKDLGNDRVDD